MSINTNYETIAIQNDNFLVSQLESQYHPGEYIDNCFYQKEGQIQVLTRMVKALAEHLFKQIKEGESEWEAYLHKLSNFTITKEDSNCTITFDFAHEGIYRQYGESVAAQPFFEHINDKFSVLKGYMEKRYNVTVESLPTPKHLITRQTLMPQTVKVSWNKKKELMDNQAEPQVSKRYSWLDSDSDSD